MLGYRIQYSPEDNRKYPIRVRMRRSERFVAFAVVTVVFLAAAVYVGKYIDLQSLLIPGDPQITSAAVSDLVSSVKCGEPIGDAVTVFCRQIITAANGA